jgi:hypothetical protein
VLGLLSSAEGRALDKLFSRIRKKYRDVPPNLRAELRLTVSDLLRRTIEATDAGR